MDISDKDFIRLTTEGYPLTLRHSLESFFNLFAHFVNESNENSFFAEVVEDGVKMHAGMKTEICRIIYEKDRVIISTNIEDNEYSTTSEYSSDEEIKILGWACLGVLYFCDLYALGTGQEAQFASSSPTKKDIKTPVDNNKKYNAWPV